MATQMGLEPTTSSVTGWHSNQLNYRTVLNFKITIIILKQICSKSLI